jgi:hypothetical protein
MPEPKPPRELPDRGPEFWGRYCRPSRIRVGLGRLLGWFLSGVVAEAVFLNRHAERRLESRARAMRKSGPA